MKYCYKCGNPMEDDMLFCQKCGTKAVADENTDVIFDKVSGSDQPQQARSPVHKMLETFNDFCDDTMAKNHEDFDDRMRRACWPMWTYLGYAQIPRQWWLCWDICCSCTNVLAFCKVSHTKHRYKRKNPFQAVFLEFILIMGFVGFYIAFGLFAYVLISQ